jgi:cell division protein FtsI/penicillin-binding protein 2
MREHLAYSVRKHTARRRLKRRLLFASVISLVFVGGVFAGGWLIGFGSRLRNFGQETFGEKLLTKAEIRSKISAIGSAGDASDVYQFRQNEVVLPGIAEPVVLEYSFDPSIQSMAEDLLDQYRPDLGVMVAMDASTGRVLAMAGRNEVFRIDGHPAFQTTFPSASVFKVITAAAALEQQKANPHTLIAFAGRNHTLYKYQVLRERVSGWMRHISLKDAFAKSVNTVFGRLAVHEIGSEPLKNFSTRFAFDEEIQAEFPAVKSHAANPSTAFELAEMASGFTQDNVISPLHGAMIAATVANEGVMMQPYFLNAAFLKSGKTLYRSEPAIQGKVISAETAAELKTLMRETVTTGTSRKAFRGFFRGRFSGLDVGGKTGHLTDQNLQGKIDWFVGFAQAHGRKIAVSVLTMHKKVWTVKSSDLARKAIETAFSQKQVVRK